MGFIGGVAAAANTVTLFLLGDSVATLLGTVKLRFGEFAVIAGVVALVGTGLIFYGLARKRRILTLLGGVMSLASTFCGFTALAIIGAILMRSE